MKGGERRRMNKKEKENPEGQCIYIVSEVNFTSSQR
jgi:hypothetical protein